MLALQFGAGNIGRGFIGLLLQKSGYDVCFVDVNEQVVHALNERRQYDVVLANETKESVTVTGVRALNSRTEREAVIAAIREADVITTAVGPSVLPLIAPLLAEGLSTRTTPLAIIACENMIGGSSALRQFVLEHGPVNDAVQFLDSAVDRIVPNQAHDDLLRVVVEPFHEWVVQSPVALPIEGALFVDDLTPYIERKLFTVNTGHAAAAYYGAKLGYSTIQAAMTDEAVVAHVRGTIAETGQVLIAKYGFSAEEHEAYMAKIISRFVNPYLTDAIDRVCRAPIRKLGAADRLVNPTLQYMERFGEVPSHLVETIAATLSYRHEDDEEARELAVVMERASVVAALGQFASLAADHQLIEAVVDRRIVG